MSVTTGYTKEKLTRANSDGNHDLISRWTSSDTVEFADGATLTTKMEQKQATITGGATTIASSNLTASRALVSNSSGKVAVSAVTSTELGYLDGVTSNVQTQLGNKLNSSAVTTSLASTSTTTALAASAGKSLQDQITTLNSDLEQQNVRGIITVHQINSSQNLKMSISPFGAFILMGFMQGVGAVVIMCVNNSGTVQWYDLTTGQLFNFPNGYSYSLSSDKGTVTLSTTYSDNSTFTAICGGMDVGVI